jgi:DNA-binding transcriptional ArsR family regulator
MATDQLSLVFSALADPTRRQILSRVSNGEETVTALAEPFPISLPAISRHLKVLERAGLIVRSRNGKFRSSTLRGAALDEAFDWMTHCRVRWDERFARLDDHLAHQPVAETEAPE